jgi:hypothetical protein
MTTVPGTDWKAELGISGWEPPAFFSGARDVDAAGRPVPQAHALRRAFDGLDLDGILCLHNAPVVYFKEVRRIEPAAVRELHLHFWNQGLAPILALITPKEVHVYSGLATPPRAGEDVNAEGRLVQTLSRVADAAELRQLVLALGSGEYFRTHSRSFNPRHRVDRELLRNLEAAREEMAAGKSLRLDPRLLDALLCRVVFTCYLLDRKIIGASYLAAAGIHEAESLSELLARPKREAKEALYTLFERLGDDFNGDLFSDDLAEEARHITADHLETLGRLLRGADVRTGQGSFWPYDFGVIPIETISAIYEHFLKAADPRAKKRAGAFYTPRFLAEIVLDLALEGMDTLLDKRFLDPACGSGIFLVGLFNRLAEEWKRKNPHARYERQAGELLAILRDNLFGVDENATACRIAAFSLYLALLDQLKPSDIQELQRKKKFLPRLVLDPGEGGAPSRGRTIYCGDFFTADAALPTDAFDAVIGNPPWTSVTGPTTAAEKWCAERGLPIANRQLALAFVWKGATHQRAGGHVCLVLPHGVLFNHQEKALRFQREWVKRHSIDLVLNLTDFQRFLFEGSEAPALVARYRKEAPSASSVTIQYLSPKTDWGVSQAEIISVAPEDRAEVELKEVVAGLRDDQPATVWKARFWGSPRDAKLIDRLALFPRLYELARQPREKAGKRWVVAQGFQPEKPGAETAKSKRRPWPKATAFLEAGSRAIDLFVLGSDSTPIASRFPWLRRLPEASEIFEAPHVLVTKGLRVAYSDFDVVFRHALQGIHGPKKDRDLLTFLAAYLRSPLARYFLFHTSSSWGVSRSEVHLEELLELPFPLPEQTPRPSRAGEIVATVAACVREAMAEASRPLTDRQGIVREAQAAIEPLLFEYFDLDDVEKVLVQDTNRVIIPSTRPSRASDKVPTLRPSSSPDREAYKDLLCETLNDWARGGPYQVSGEVHASAASGLAVVVLRRGKAGTRMPAEGTSSDGLLPVLDRLRKAFKRELGSVEVLRGLKVFDRDILYVVKPLSRRFWTQTAALNDADEIAAAALSSRSAREET